MRRKPMKCRLGDVLRGRNDALEKIDVAVEVPMVDRIDELAPENAVDLLEVDDHPGAFVDGTADRDFDHVVVAVIVSAKTEDLAVPLFGPLWAAQDVRRREGGSPRDAHGCGHRNVPNITEQLSSLTVFRRIHTNIRARERHRIGRRQPGNHPRHIRWLEAGTLYAGDSQHRRIHRAGADGVDADSNGPALDRERLRQTCQAGLRRDVRSHTWKLLRAGHPG